MDITKAQEFPVPPMYQWATDLFPICRSLTGDGVRTTLQYLKKLVPELTIHSIPSGTQVFDWTIPNEWNIQDAYILDKNNRKIVDFKTSNLHVLGYSTPIDQWMDLEELDTHLYSLPDMPEAIPYVTSYYKERWGFCLPHALREKLTPGQYRAVIKSKLKPGVLNYGDILIPGQSEKEILLSTYVCHPSMANNELSGPTVAIALAQWLKSLPKRQYSYRIVFVPETIGSIAYLSQHLKHMKKVTIAGYVLSCVGDDRAYSYLPSRLGETLADRAALAALAHYAPQYETYSFLDRGSDERQYCSPHVELPVASVMRTRYGSYPEYHTSLDDLSIISQAGLAGAFEIYRSILLILENNQNYKIITPCEPQMGKRGLYPTIGTRDADKEVRDMMNVLSYCDGNHDLIGVAKRCNLDPLRTAKIQRTLSKAGLILPQK